MKSPARLLTLLCFLCLSQAWAEVRLASIFSSNMVIQQEKPIVVWGWDAPGTAVTVSLGSQTAQATANAKGEWKVTLAAMKADGKTYTLVAKGSSTAECGNVVLGEVWLCSGQSNMEFGIRNVIDAPAEIAAANYPNIRLFFVPKKFLAAPTNGIPSAWVPCASNTIALGHSAVGYFFGRTIHTNLNVPVGLITSSWGGTRIEPWTVPDGFAMVPVLQSQMTQALAMDPASSLRKKYLETYLQKIEAWVGVSRKAIGDETANEPVPPYPPELLPPVSQQQPAVLYNGMIHALVPFALRGALWYQGESNSPEGLLYTEKMKALILGWRKIWGSEFSFYFVQIAPYHYGNALPHVLAEFWEGQDLASRMIPKTGMAVINDIGDIKDIHPRNKQEVGRRLALHALAKDYGQGKIEWSGPLYKSHKVEGEKVVVSFDHAGSGLMSRDSKPLTHWELIDATVGGWTPAEALISGNQVVLSAPGVKNPLALRHAWHKLAEPNFINKEGLPAVPFRAGAWSNRDALSLNVAELKDYQLVLELDIAKISGSPTYTTDKRPELTKAFDRIAYYLELKNADGTLQWIWVSMDAYTTEPGKLGVPTLENKAIFQQLLTGMTVFSSVPGVTSGTGLKGNIEFWTHNYGGQNAKNVPNASPTDFDFGDQMSEPALGHGSMQIHNYEAKQVLFAMNGWRGGNPDLGIGNRPNEKNTDWTFAANARTYTSKIMKVYVRVKGN